jgi:hypothetical protein
MLDFFTYITFYGGHAVAKFVGLYATSQKDAGLIPDEVIGFFN